IVGVAHPALVVLRIDAGLKRTKNEGHGHRPHSSVSKYHQRSSPARAARCRADMRSECLPPRSARSWQGGHAWLANARAFASASARHQSWHTWSTSPLTSTIAQSLLPRSRAIGLADPSAHRSSDGTLAQSTAVQQASSAVEGAADQKPCLIEGSL